MISMVDGRARVAVVATMAALSGCAGSQTAAPGPLQAASPAMAASAAPTPDSLFKRGLEAARTGDSTRAEQYLVAAMEGGLPPHQVLPSLLAVCVAANRLDAALHYARERLLREPESGSLRYLVASLHVAMGQEDRARKELNRLIDEEPARGDSYYLLGVIESESVHNRRAAARAFERYLNLSPTGIHAAEARAFLRDRSNTKLITGKRAP